MEVRLSALLGLVGFTVLCVGVAAASGSVLAASSPPRDAVDYLKTRGLLPLWASVTRPILPWDLEAALDVSGVRARLSTLSAPDLAVLRLLDVEFGRHSV